MAMGIEGMRMLERPRQGAAVPAAAAPARGDGVGGSEKLQKAAEDFEGMLLGQMLQSIRDSALGGWQEEKDQSGAIALEMAEGQLARVMASNGGLGLAKSLASSMSREPQPQSAGPKVVKSESGS